jgi:hypothetical protein
MSYVLTFLSGFALGVVLNRLLEKRAVEEIQKLRLFVAAELQKLAAKL